MVVATVAPVMAIGVYPGSFDPPTVAHLHVAEAAREQCGLTRVDLSLSFGALGKDDAGLSTIDERLEVLELVAATRPWLGVRTTRARLLADVAEGYDALVMGADKWLQVLDPAWYGSVAARDDALARLPLVCVAPRAGVTIPPTPSGVRVVLLEVDESHHGVSATAARAGRDDWVLPEARAWWARQSTSRGNE